MRVLPWSESDRDRVQVVAGDCCRACLNRSPTADAPSSTNLSTNSAPVIDNNGTLASPAVARANSVFPVSEGPTSSTALGIRAPRGLPRVGSLRNAMTSRSSSLASSAPLYRHKWGRSRFRLSSRPGIVEPGFVRNGVRDIGCGTRLLQRGARACPWPSGFPEHEAKPRP